MSDDPIAYERDGKVFYRASAIGGCPVALAAARQDLDKHKPPAKMQEIFDGGHEAEAQFKALYPNVLSGGHQMACELPVTGRISVVGHIDGLHEPRIGEVKSQSDEEYDKWTPDKWVSDPLWIRYGWQVSCYMLALDRELSLIRVKRSDPEQFEIWTVERPFHTLDEIREKVLEAESLARDDVLLCTGPYNYPCPYPFLHQECPVCDDEELLQAVSDYIISISNIKAQEEIKKNARTVIEKFLVGQDGNKLMTPTGVRLSRSEFDRKEKIIPAGHEVRITVTPPK